MTVTILNQNVALTRNLFFSLQRYRLLWFILLLTIVLDYVSTLNFMINGSIALEANKIIRFLAYEFGIFQGVMIGKALQIVSAIGFCALSRELSRAVLFLIIGLNCFAVFVNIFYSPSILLLI